MFEPQSNGNVVAVDVGGANLKFADDGGRRWSERFELWCRLPELRDRLRHHLRGYAVVLVTMTGELADCFATRRQGVGQIADAVTDAVKEQRDAPEIWFYGLDGQFASIDRLKENPIRFAASNWHATATAAARVVNRPTILVDIGSTTTDILEVTPQKEFWPDQTDDYRLSRGTLVYIGDRRTPVCSLVDSVVLGGTRYPVMRELFATIGDARRLLKLAPEDTDDTETANGAGGSIRHCATRMLRMIGCDLDDHTPVVAAEMARQVHLAARRKISDAVMARIHGTFASLLPIDRVLIGSAADLIEPDCGEFQPPPPGMSDDPTTALLTLWRADPQRADPQRAASSQPTERT